MRRTRVKRDLPPCIRACATSPARSGHHSADGMTRGWHSSLLGAPERAARRYPTVGAWVSLIPAPTINSQRAVKPSEPSNWPSSSSISAHAAARSASETLASIWVSAPNASRWNRTHSAADGRCNGAEMTLVSMALNPVECQKSGLGR